MTWQKKIAYIWDYYKWVLIGALLIILAVVTTVRQVNQRVSYDTQMLFAGTLSASDENKQQFSNLLHPFVSDTNQDGESNLLLTFCSLTQENMEIDSALVSKVQAVLIEGETTVFLVNSYFLQVLGEQGAFADLPEEWRNTSCSYAVELSPENPYFSFFYPEEPLYLAIRYHDDLSALSAEEQADFQNAYRILEEVCKANGKS